MSKEDVIKKLKAKFKKDELAEMLVDLMADKEVKAETAPKQEAPEESFVQEKRTKNTVVDEHGQKMGIFAPVRKGPRENKFFDMAEAQMEPTDVEWAPGKKPAPRMKNPKHYGMLKCFVCEKQFEAYLPSVSDRSSARCEACKRKK